MVKNKYHKYFGQFNLKDYQEYKKYRAINLKSKKIQLWSQPFEYDRVHSIIHEHEMEQVGHCDDGNVYAHWKDNMLAIVVENDNGQFGGMVVECHQVLDTISHMNTSGYGLTLKEPIAKKVDLHDKCNYYRTHSN